jgi:hypothetical protein
VRGAQGRRDDVQLRRRVLPQLQAPHLVECNVKRLDTRIHHQGTVRAPLLHIAPLFYQSILLWLRRCPDARHATSKSATPSLRTANHGHEEVTSMPAEPRIGEGTVSRRSALEPPQTPNRL